MSAQLQMQTLSQAFWANVDRRAPDQCWPWTSGTNGAGYGRFALFGKLYYAHRQAYLERVGSIPDGMIVRHRCDNPICCNPDHLEPGTMADNTQDAVTRGRFAGRATPKGDTHGMSKLNGETVREIRSRFSIDRRGDAIRVSEQYGIGRSQARRILEGTAWASL